MQCCCHLAKLSDIWHKWYRNEFHMISYREAVKLSTFNPPLVVTLRRLVEDPPFHTYENICQRVCALNWLQLRRLNGLKLLLKMLYCIWNHPNVVSFLHVFTRFVCVCSREEQYRQMWAEFERFVRSHADTSPMHQKVLECLVECKKLPSDSAKASSLSELQDQTDRETDR